MNRRKIIIGDYDTSHHGPWTLASCVFQEPAYQSMLVSVPGRDGQLDLSTVLTGGEPKYGNRKLAATLECSEGTRAERETLINEMVNRLDGRRVDIILPDDPARYITGRVSVKREYNDMAHAAVTVTAVCDPWRQNLHETTITVTATNTEQVGVLHNTGRRVLRPDVTVKGNGAKIQLTIGEYTWDLSKGSYTLLELQLKPGNTSMTYSGKGQMVITYREAVL